MRLVPSIGLILNVVLAGGAGCGWSSALFEPNAAGTDGGAPDDAGAAPPEIRNRAIAIAVGRLHVCAILDDHKVKCWGSNDSGELGLGDTKDRGLDSTTMGNNLPTVDLGTGRTAKSLTAGVYTTCAILDDDTLKCWGRGAYATPNFTDSTGNIGDEPGEMGDHLKPIDLGPGRRPVAVATGFGETGVALDEGSFVFWSNGSSTKVPPVADGARVVQLVSATWTVGLFDDGSVRQISDVWPPGLKPLDLAGREASFLGGSRDGYCAIPSGGGALCTFVIPPLPTSASVVAVAITEYGHACGLDAAGAATCWNIEAHPEWGDTESGSAVGVPLDQPVKSMGAGDYNACALLADGTVKCWAIDGTYPLSLGGSVSTSTGWPAVDLGTRPNP
jgi:hypothetical protein